MRFMHPELLWLLAALPLLALAGMFSAARRRAALRRFAGGLDYVSRFDRIVSHQRRWVKTLLVYFALACSVVALARPQWGSRLEQVERRGIDVAILVDTSLSMAAEDLAPNRLTHALEAIDRLVESLAGNRVSLIRFAGQPTLMCPMTLDHGAVRLFLDTIDPETTQVPGTALAEALELAVGTFRDEPDVGDGRSRALLLFTDGEDHEGGLDEALRALIDHGISVFAVGVGTTRGAPIPLQDGPGYKKDRDGKVVTTRLEPAELERLALETGGRYHKASVGGQEIEEITAVLASLDAREYGSVLRARYEERFQIPLVMALVALLAECLVGERRKLPGRSI